MRERFFTSLPALLASSLFSPRSLYMMCPFPPLSCLADSRSSSGSCCAAPSLEGFQTSPWQIVAASGHPQHLTVAPSPAIAFCYYVFIF